MATANSAPEVRIVGAGPAGLTAAITAARAGLRVAVYELRADVGHRFHDDFQGLENWTTESDVIAELSAIGVEPTFESVPFRTQTCWDARGREYVFRSQEPLYYLVRRGTGPGTLDHALKKQALAAGVEIHFNNAVNHLPEGGIVATGPRAADAVAVGYVGRTSLDDGAYAVVNEELAPGGYSYLLVVAGRATVATCLFTDFHNDKAYLERTLEFFQSKTGLQMTDARRFGGIGNFQHPPVAIRGRLVFAGEAAGFQDALWGFGMRYAMVTGHLAAAAVTAGDPKLYERLWRARFDGVLKAATVNRFLYAHGGAMGIRWLLTRLQGSPSVRRTLLRYSRGARWKSLAFPLVKPWVRSARRRDECVSDACDCTWCRCHRGTGDRSEHG